MANFFAKLFGFPSKKPDLNQGTPLPQTLAGIPEFDKLRNQASNPSIGFGERFTERATNPFIKQLEADLPRQIAAAREASSARGMGRSTMGQQVEGNIQAQHELDINKLISNAFVKNLEQGKLDEARNQQLLDSLFRAENEQQRTGLLNEQQKRLRNIGFDEARRNQETKSLSSIAEIFTPSIFNAASNLSQGKLDFSFIPPTGDNSGNIGGVDVSGVDDNTLMGIIKSALDRTAGFTTKQPQQKLTSNILGV